MAPSAVVTGIGCALPGDLHAADLLRAEAPAGAAPVDPAARLGRRGLRYKDRATQLGLCAAHDALRDAGLLRDPGLAVAGDAVGVVVSSNLGNVDTVCRVAEQIARDTVAGISPMDLPNASSNVVASTIAIRFGLRGVNLTLCNGATSGLDAVSWATALVTAGRVDHVVVVGVEAANPVVERLLGSDRVLDGAVAVVVEQPGTAARRAAEPLAAVAAHARRASVEDCLAAVGVGGGSAPGLWLIGDDREVPTAMAGVKRHDVAQSLGQCSGALGVLQCAAGASWVAAGGEGPVLATAGGPGDDAVGALVMASGRPR